MQLFVYKDRHVVVSRDDGANVMWVCLVDGIEGVKKRGRPPGTAKVEGGVRRFKAASTELRAVTESDVGDVVVARAEKVLAADDEETADSVVVSAETVEA